LSNRGAEIIAWPVWGCNPEQARARACENQVYLASSTYEDVSRDWMLTAIYGQDGSVLAQAREWGTGLRRGSGPEPAHALAVAG
jgi:predicted amidohydrolase